jgi:hypothetical protein
MPLKRDMSAFRPAISAVLAAIAITTMGATGFSARSAFPLAPLLGVLEWIERSPRRSLGFVWGGARHYGLAAPFPVMVIGVIACIAALAGDRESGRLIRARALLEQHSGCLGMQHSGGWGKPPFLASAFIFASHSAG